MISPKRRIVEKKETQILCLIPNNVASLHIRELDQT